MVSNKEGFGGIHRLDPGGKNYCTLQKAQNKMYSSRSGSGKGVIALILLLYGTERETTEHKVL